MLLGASDGSLVITLRKNAYCPGDTLSGKIRLQLAAPKKARELRIEFYGEVHKRRGDRTLVERVFSVEKMVYGEKVYKPNEEHEFELDIPENLLKRAQSAYVSSISKFFAPAPQAWYLHATLDIPLEFDIHERVEVNIVPPKRG